MTEQEVPAELELAEQGIREVEAENNDDVAVQPGPNADDPADIDPHIRADVRRLYEVYSYRHAAAILSYSFPNELADLQRVLLDFRLTMRDLGMPGGNESDIPKKFSRMLRPQGWVETRIQGDLLMRLEEYDELFLPDGRSKKVKRLETMARPIKNYIDGHKIDYVKG